MATLAVRVQIVQYFCVNLTAIKICAMLIENTVKTNGPNSSFCVHNNNYKHKEKTFFAERLATTAQVKQLHLCNCRTPHNITIETNRNPWTARPQRHINDNMSCCVEHASPALASTRCHCHCQYHAVNVLPTVSSVSHSALVSLSTY